MKNVGNFRGVFSKDMLPKEIKSSECGCINLQDYFTGEGTHWVCYYNDPLSKDVEYFDSYGIVPSDIIKKYLLQPQKGLVYNSSKIQSDTSIMCGYYCIYYMLEREKGRHPVDILLDFDQQPTIFNENKMSIFAATLG